MTFDQLAKAYRWLEYAFFGKALWRCRVFFLPEIGQVTKILLLGDGDGRFTAELAMALPEATLYYVDGSAEMLRLARERVKRSRGVRRDGIQYIQADIRHQIPVETKELDLIVTHFCLDCLTQNETDALAANLGRLCRPGTRWMISEFAVPAKQPFRWLGRLLIRGLYFCTSVLTGLPVRQLPDYRASLKASGFELTRAQTGLFALLTSELWILKLPLVLQEKGSGKDLLATPVPSTKP